MSRTTMVQDKERMAQVRDFAKYLIDSKVILTNDLRKVLRVQNELDMRIGALATIKNFIKPHDVIYLLSCQQENKSLFGELAVRQGMMEEGQVELALSMQKDPFRLFFECLLMCRVVDRAAMPRIVMGYKSRKSGNGNGNGKTISTSVFRQQLGEDIVTGAKAQTVTEAIKTTPAAAPAPKPVAAPAPEAPPAEEPLREISDVVAEALGTRLTETKVKTKLKRIERLATLPAVVHQLLSLLGNPGTELEKVARTIETDPALTTQLLRMANSAAFGLSRKASNASQVLLTMGFNGVRKVVLTVAVFEKFKGVKAKGITALWRESLCAGQWARVLLKHKGARNDMQENAFMGGLLHDLGRIALWQFFPEACEQVEQLVEQGYDRMTSEREVFGLSHPEVGAWLADYWKFPKDLQRAILHHHLSTEQLAAKKASGTNPVVRSVNAATCLAELSMCINLSEVDERDFGPLLDLSALDEAFVSFHMLDLASIHRDSRAVILESKELADTLMRR